jgi:hypothetical protein
LTYLEFWTNSPAQKTAELIPLKSGQQRKISAEQGNQMPAAICGDQQAFVDEKNVAPTRNGSIRLTSGDEQAGAVGHVTRRAIRAER